MQIQKNKKLEVNPFKIKKNKKPPRSLSGSRNYQKKEKSYTIGCFENPTGLYLLKQPISNTTNKQTYKTEI